MTASDSVSSAVRALGAHWLRSGLTVLGIVIGVAATLCVVSIGAGARVDIANRVRTLGSNLLLVQPDVRHPHAIRPDTSLAPALTEEDALAIRRQVQGVQFAAPLVSRQVQLVASDRNWLTVVAGVGDDYLAAREWTVAEGRSFFSSELDFGAKVAILGADVSKSLLGDEQGPGAVVRIGSVPFTVIGILGAKGVGSAGRSQDDVVFIPLSAARSRVLGSVHSNSRDALDLIAIKLFEGAEATRVSDDVESVLRRRHHVRDGMASDFKVQSPLELMKARETAVQTMDLLLTAIASISLVVGGTSIMNMMIVSVTERTREIGLRLAVGARPRDICLQFLVEALVLSLLGGLFGSVLGSISAFIVALTAGWPVLISPWNVVLVCGFAGLVGIAFGFYPAYRASRMDPISALRCD